MSKDFYLTLQGKLLIEIGEMDGFNRAEITKVKTAISTPTDRYRVPYGHRAADHPRRCIFVGTTNDDHYLKDPSGARRFWPVRCGAIRLGLLAEDRDQLFAEAVVQIKEGRTWYETPVDDTRREQESRRERDEWQTVIERYIEQEPTNNGSDEWMPRFAPLVKLTVPDVLQKVLHMGPQKWTTPDQRRVAAILKAMGWRSNRRMVDGKYARMWLSPEVAHVIDKRNPDAPDREPGED